MICHICAAKTGGREMYHVKCLEDFFGVKKTPKIDLGLSDITVEAQKMAGKLSISGVQPKVSIKLNKTDGKMEVVAVDGRYILKPQSRAFRHLPENEFTCTALAKRTGIEVPGFAIAKLKDGSYAYIVKRFDRSKTEKIHVEDFAQILGKNDKYKGSYEEIGRELKKISDVPGLDAQNFFERTLFYYIIGNGDAHMKNFSVIYDVEGRVRLAPAYDIVSSKIVIPDEEETALAVNGKRNNIGKKDFAALAGYLGINAKYTEKVFQRYLDERKMLRDIPVLNVAISGAIKKIIRRRISNLA